MAVTTRHLLWQKLISTLIPLLLTFMINTYQLKEAKWWSLSIQHHPKLADDSGPPWLRQLNTLNVCNNKCNVLVQLDA